MSNDRKNMAFGKMNYQLLFATIFMIILGLTIMSLDSQTFGFGFMGLTLGPIVLFLGFALGFFAILFTPKSGEKK